MSFQEEGVKMAKVCYGCPDRYPACQDQCQKPEVVKEREDKIKRYEGRMRELEANELIVDRIRRARKK